MARVSGVERWRLGWSLLLEWAGREEEQAEGDGVSLAQEPVEDGLRWPVWAAWDCGCR